MWIDLVMILQVNFSPNLISFPSSSMCGLYSSNHTVQNCLHTMQIRSLIGKCNFQRAHAQVHGNEVVRAFSRGSPGNGNWLPQPIGVVFTLPGTSERPATHLQCHVDLHRVFIYNARCFLFQTRMALDAIASASTP